MTEAIHLTNAEAIKEKQWEHKKPTQSADALFNFMKEYEHLEDILRQKMLSPRYCKEDIRYLQIAGLDEIAFPMKCFCDINFHKLSEHIFWYGKYAIAFSKEYGINNGVQPITYVNPDSKLAEDFRIAFGRALKERNQSEEVTKNLKNYIAHQLMYMKPIQGDTWNHLAGEYQSKCLMDESEWRFVPDVTMYQMKQAITDKDELDKSVLIFQSNALNGRPDCSLQFSYDEIKYIIIAELAEIDRLEKLFDEMNLERSESNRLMSKVIVWDEWKGDF